MLALLCSRNPLSFAPIISVTGRTLQGFLSGIHYKTPLAVFSLSRTALKGTVRRPH